MALSSEPAKRTLRLQYASDLHLEHRSWPAIEKLIDGVQRLAPVLILAGDIGDPFRDSYARFVRAMSERFDWVLVVAGNHEFYGHAPGETMARIAQVCRVWSNVVFLDNQAWEMPASGGPPNSETTQWSRVPLRRSCEAKEAAASGQAIPARVRFFGGTMWSCVKDEERAEVQRVLNDFACIRGFGLAEYVNAHWQFVDLLEDELRVAGGAQRTHHVVISHYLPSYRLIHPDYRDSPINSAFATEMAAADDPRIIAWFYGHTHKGQAGPRFFCNPLGYPGENSDPTCNAVAEIELE